LSAVDRRGAGAVTARSHALAVSLLLGVATATGAYAVVQTGNIGHASTKPEVATDAAIAARSRKLDAWQASLRKALAQRPPALPPLNRYAAVTGARSPVAMAPLPALSAAPQKRAVTAVMTASNPRKQTHTQRATDTTAPHRASPRHADEDASELGAAPATAAPAPDPGQAAPVKSEQPTPPSQPAPPAPPASSPPTSTSLLSVEAQCRTLLQAAENKGEQAKRTAESQCEALKQAAERSGTGHDD
jgi:hypothetical protein